MPISLFERAKWYVPSLITLSALISGLTSVRMAATSNWDAACGLIFLSAFLDGLDGHVARFLGACTPMGFQLDSLCDLANFGVVPALVLWFWGRELPKGECREEGCYIEEVVLWGACCLHVICCCLRLARFNVAGMTKQMEELLLKDVLPKPPLPKVYTHNLLQRDLYFQGLPAPLGAAYALLPVIFRLSNLAEALGYRWTFGRAGCSLALFVVAFLMISKLPTLNSRMYRSSASDTILKSRHPIFMLLKFVVVLTAAIGFRYYVYDTCLVIVFVHVVSLPLGFYVYYFHATAKHN